MAIRSLRLLGQSSEVMGPFAPIRNVDDELREASRDEVRVFAILLDDYHVVRQRELRVIPPLRSFIEHLPVADLVGVYGLFDSIADPHLNRDRRGGVEGRVGVLREAGRLHAEVPGRGRALKADAEHRADSSRHHAARARGPGHPSPAA